RRVREQPAERYDDVADSPGRFPLRLERRDERIDVARAESGKGSLAKAREHVPAEIDAVALVRRGREPRPAGRRSGRIASLEPMRGVLAQRLRTGLAPCAGVDLALTRREGAFGLAAAGPDRLPSLFTVNVVDDRVVAAWAPDDRASSHAARSY